MLNIVIKGEQMTLGVIYGPNKNDRDFFMDIEKQIQQWGNKCILGGDYNTILSQERGPANLDCIASDWIPNLQNSNIINGWINRGLLIDPFRSLYPEEREVSYVSFKGEVDREGGRKTGRTRLDFFLISPEYIDWVDKVRYEDRLGADFNHKEVIMKLGRNRSTGRRIIYDSTLEDEMATYVGIMAVYDSIEHNLVDKDEGLNNNLVQLNILMREKTDDIIRRKEKVELNIQTTMERLPGLSTLLDNEIECSYKVLYETIMNDLKNRLGYVQDRIKIESKLMRDRLVQREEYMADTFGEESQQQLDVRAEILCLDDVNLKQRANKFRDFLRVNNEKATKAFCKLSKEGGYSDDIYKIRKESGEAFNNNTDRGRHIEEYYGGIYKKKGRKFN
jgi:hypothetical protein